MEDKDGKRNNDKERRLYPEKNVSQTPAYHNHQRGYSGARKGIGVNDARTKTREDTPMSIKILDIRLQNHERPLKAFVDIEFYGLAIRDFRIIQQPGHKAYVVAPQTAWKGQQGKPNFKPLISMPNAIKWQIESAVLAEYQRATEASNGNST